MPRTTPRSPGTCCAARPNPDDAWRAPEYPGELAGISAAFRSLPAADQELLALAAWEGLTTGQIAAVLGCSPNAVRIRRHRARRRFTALLASGQTARQADGHVANGDLT
jgi:DNA-directed RNA polymerase specialized sigma24 family protein